ncbi:uncharacterized protein LOC142226378 [Haematobia irritans]|uniref:uncharacterized protein LOC142226378 n=1 Tax=Haematobia irritans TaxID=7368 RepID=UPI003F4F7C94
MDGLNRLDFTKIVNKHLQEQQRTKFFKPTILNELNSGRTNVYANNVKMTHDHHFNFEDRLKAIAAHVYSQLYETKSSQPPKNATVEDAMEPIRIPDVESPEAPDKNKTSSIPRIKILCDQKEKKRLHCTIPPPEDANNFVNQKRLIAMNRKHAILASMLEDQKKLQNDRLSITQEICNVRNRLEMIRGRVNSSLTKLEENKTKSKSTRVIKGEKKYQRSTNTSGVQKKKSNIELKFR